MTALSTAEVMEALGDLGRFIDREIRLCRKYAVEFPSRCATEQAHADRLDLHRRTLALCEKHAPAILQLEAEEQSGDRKARLTFTAEEVRANLEALPPLHSDAYWGCDPVARSVMDKLDAALKSLNPPEILESSDREDEG